MVVGLKLVYVPFSVALYCQPDADCVPLFWVTVTVGAVIICPSQIAEGASIVLIVGGLATITVAEPLVLPATSLQYASESFVI